MIIKKPKINKISHLKFKTKLIVKSLYALGQDIIRLHKEERKFRLILTDTDFLGRDVLTIIC